MDQMLSSFSLTDFSWNWNVLAEAVYTNNVDHGFWHSKCPQLFIDDAEYDMEAAQKLCLIHSEISEALEEIRKSVPEGSEKIPGFSKLEEELADAVIRIMDFANAYHLNLPEAIVAKHRYNVGREHKHGKNF